MVVSLNSRLESNKEEEEGSHQPRALRRVRARESARCQVGEVSQSLYISQSLYNRAKGSHQPCALSRVRAKERARRQVGLVWGLGFRVYGLGFRV